MSRVIVGTGHGLERLGGDRGGLFRELVDIGMEILDDQNPDLVVSGMEMGFHVGLAHAAFLSKIPLVLVLPYRGWSKRWPSDWRGYMASAFHYAWRKDHAVPHGLGRRTPKEEIDKAMLARNHRLLDYAVAYDSTVTALWDGQPGGGTAYTIGRAIELGVPVKNYWKGAGNENPV